MREDIIEMLRGYFIALDREIDLSISDPVISMQAMEIRSMLEQELRYLTLTENDMSLMSMVDSMVRDGKSIDVESLCRKCDTTTAEDYIRRIGSPDRPKSDGIYA